MRRNNIKVEKKTTNTQSPKVSKSRNNINTRVNRK